MSSDPTKGDAIPPQELQHIALSGPTEDIALYQLAARWAERYVSPDGGTLKEMLLRFRQAYDYLDAVTHGNKPPELE